MTVESIRPFVGLRHYDVDEADLFFGRDAETQVLTTLVLGHRLVVLYGRSGSGKTSLLHAGVIAGLGPDDASVLAVGRPVHSSAYPTASTPAYNPFTFALLSSWAPHLPPHTIRGLTISQFLLGLDVGLDRYDGELPLIAVVDQFEEVFGDIPQWTAHRDGFLDQLAEAVKTVERLHLLLSLDQRVLGEVLPHEARLSRGDRSYYRLLPLGREAALEAVKGPLTSTGRSFAPGVAEALVDRLRTTNVTNALGVTSGDVAGPVEPRSLQVVCTALWQGLPDGVATITRDHLEAYADVESILTDLCAQAVDEVAAAEGLAEPVLWKWLEETFVTDLGTRGVAYEGLDTTAGLPHSVARAFEKHSILRSEKRLGSVWFELQHDGLIGPIRRGREQAGDVGTPSETEDTPGTRLRMAETALAEGTLDLARKYATEAASGSDDDPATLAEARSLLGEILVQAAQDATGDQVEALYQEAQQHYEAAMELFQERDNSAAVSRVLAALGRLERVRGHTAEALDLLHSALERRQGDPDLYVELAQVTRESGQPLAALGHYSSALTFAPENVAALVGRGTIHVDRGDAAAALADIDKATRLEPALALRPDVSRTRRRALDLQEAAS